MKKTTTEEKTTLTLLERFVLSTVLAKEGDIKTITVSRDIKSKIEVTQAEWKKFDIKVLDSGNMSWNEAAAKATFDYEFTEFEKLDVKLGLQKLDSDKKLTVEHLSLYDIFVK